MINENNDINKRLNHSYATGIIMAINAISDSAVIFDSPNCIMHIPNKIQINHDIFSSLIPAGGPNRVITTGADIKNLHGNRDAAITGKIKDTAAAKQFKQIFFSAMPVTNATGVDYDRILRKANQDCRTNVLKIEPKNLTHDWLDGYRQVMSVLAQNMKFSPNKKIRNSIAFVGYIMDRNEGDHRGNIDEIKKICNSIGITPVSFWLDGGPIDSLKNIEKAELIIAFNEYAETAEIIAAKTGADILVLEPPFGLKNTEQFIKQIAAHFHKAGIGQRIIKEELRSVIPLVSRIFEPVITANTFSYYGEPYFGKSFFEAMNFFNARINNMVFFSRERKDLADYFKAQPVSRSPMIQFQPKTSELRLMSSNIHIGNNVSENFTGDEPYVTLGYPAVNVHYFYNVPIFGFTGFVVFLNMLYNKLRSANA